MYLSLAAESDAPPLEAMQVKEKKIVLHCRNITGNGVGNHNAATVEQLISLKWDVVFVHLLYGVTADAQMVCCQERINHQRYFCQLIM